MSALRGPLPFLPGLLILLSCAGLLAARSDTQRPGGPPPAAPPALPPLVQTCPMHPDVVEVRAGTCPICRMNLVPARLDASWMCPVHAAVIEQAGGTCRLCGRSLVPVTVTAARTAMARLGGTAKTTGAGGGDIAIAVIPATEDVTQARRYLIEAGCQPLQLTVDQTGVDLQPDAQ